MRDVEGPQLDQRRSESSVSVPKELCSARETDLGPGLGVEGFKRSLGTWITKAYGPGGMWGSEGPGG